LLGDGYRADGLGQRAIDSRDAATVSARSVKKLNAKDFDAMTFPERS